MRAAGWALLAASTSAALGCHRSAAGDAGVLMARDRAWAAATAARGMPGFTSFLSPEAATLQPNQPRATPRDGLVEIWRPLLEAGSRRTIHWEPFSATLSDSGDMGFTLGSYEISSKGDVKRDVKGDADAGLREGGKPPSTGKYVTIWRKESGGEWDVVFDSGVPDPPADK